MTTSLRARRILAGTWQLSASWAFTLVYGTLLTTATLVTFGIFWRQLSPRALRFWGRTMLRIAGVRLVVEGEEHLRTPGAKVATFNHASLIDAFLIPSIMPPGSVAAIKREVIYFPVV